MDVTRELISLYADGQVTPAERAAVEAALRDDPQAALDFDEYRMVEELFGSVEPESVSEECLESLYALDQVAVLEGSAAESASGSGSRFERVEMAPVRRIPWGGLTAAAAAVMLAVFGIFQLTHSPEVVLRDFARLTLDADGAVVNTQRRTSVTMRSGDQLQAGPRERITYRDALGARVVLMPESRLDLGDPREGGLFELREGTVLLTVYDSAEPRLVHAGGYKIRSHGSNFGVRLRGPDARSAGLSASTKSPQVTVAVRTGSCEVGENGSRQQVDALWCVKLSPGKPVERERIWESGLYADLLEGRGHEIIAGFFSSESGVRPIMSYEWDRLSPTELEMVVTANESASVAHWLVVEVELGQPSALQVIRTRPIRGGEQTAEETTVSTPVVPAGRRVVAFPLDSFDAPEATVRRVENPIDRSYLVRLRLRTENGVSPLNIKASLWSARPPADAAEVVR